MSEKNFYIGCSKGYVSAIGDRWGTLEYVASPCADSVESSSKEVAENLVKELRELYPCDGIVLMKYDEQKQHIVKAENVDEVKEMESNALNSNETISIPKVAECILLAKQMIPKFNKAEMGIFVNSMNDIVKNMESRI